MSVDNSEGSFAGADTPNPGLGILQICWQHTLLVLLGLVLGLIGGGLYFSQLAPSYQSAAQLLVIKKRPDALPVGGPDSRFSLAEDFVSTHQILLRSPLIATQAVEKGNLRTLPSLAGGDPIAIISTNLQVTREAIGNSGTSVLHLSYRGPSAEDCPRVIEAVITSYKDFLDNTYRSVSEDTVKYIKQAQESLGPALAAKEEEYREFQRKHPLLRRGKDGNSALQERVFAVEQKRSGLLIQETELNARLATLEKAIKEGRSREELLALIQSQAVAATTLNIGGQPTPTSGMEESLLKLQLDEQQLLTEYGTGHPSVRDIRKRIEYLSERLRQSKAAAAAAQVASPRQPTLDPVQAAVLGLRRDLEVVQASAKALADFLQAEQVEVMKLATLETQDAAYRTEIARSQQLFNTIAKRLQEIDLVKDLSGFNAQILSPPQQGFQVAPRAMPVFLLASILGLLGGLGLAYLAEMSDHGFRTPEEIRRRLGLPVVGYVPHFVADDHDANQNGEVEVSANPQLDASVWVYHHSRSREAEAYRAVRTAVYFGIDGDVQKIIQVTSPEMGDGKTTLISNLAVSIAQSGKKVIVLDADLRRPNLHRLFGISKDRGLSSILTGEAEPHEVIQSVGVPGLSVLPAGPVPPNPAELLSLRRFKELLAMLRDQYDLILIDTPPLLAVTDPCVVSAEVDGILLVVKLSNRARPQAERAREILHTLKANVVGVVVNGGDPRSSRRYGYYRYGYGYGYGQGYYTSREEPTNGHLPSANGQESVEDGVPVATLERSAALSAGGGSHRSRSSHSHRSRSRGWWTWLTGG